MKLGSTLSQAVLCNVNVIGENFIKKTTNVCPYLVKRNTLEHYNSSRYYKSTQQGCKSWSMKNTQKSRLFCWEREREGWMGERERETIHTNQNLLCLDCIHGIQINYIYQKLISYDFTPIVLIERGLKTTWVWSK